MNIIRRKGWELPERLATPEPLFLNRRVFLNGAASVAALAAAPTGALAQRIAAHVALLRTLATRLLAVPDGY